MSYARFDKDCRWYVFGSTLDTPAGEDVLVIFDEDHEDFHLTRVELESALNSDDWTFLGRALTDSDLAILRECGRAWLIDLEKDR